jgi:two-component system NtrC family response regulator
MSDAEQNRRLLIVEDDEGMQRQLRWHFEGWEVLQARDRESALAEVRRSEPAVVLQDLGLPPDAEGVSEGFRCVQDILGLRPHTKIIVVTGHHETQNAMRAISMGACDFYEKPVDTDVLDLIVQRAFHIYHLEEQNRRLRTTARSPLDGVIAADARMLSVCRMVEKVAPTNVTCLLLGESGTGKEVLARAIHDLSPRADQPFVAINCAAVPETLMESELFGYEKGAFTGANKRTLGKVETANGGTLFLDEIGDMPTALQTRLLRVLAEGEFYRVGGQTPVRVDVRVIAATHQNLEDRVARGLFREDLFHRLNVIRMELPPLRARREDVGDLLGHYLRIAATELGVEVKTIAPEARTALEAYAWPGNVRELVNLCRRLTVLAPGSEVRAEDLPAEIAGAAAGAAANPEHWSAMLARWAEGEAQRSGARPLLDTAAPEFERALIRVALKHTGGHRQDAAKLLGWGRNTLTRKLKELGMEEAEAADDGAPSDAAA